MVSLFLVIVLLILNFLLKYICDYSVFSTLEEQPFFHLDEITFLRHLLFVDFVMMAILTCVR